MILDAGCGAGRVLEVAAEEAANVIGIDLSSAIDASAKNFSTKENIHFVQASIYELPFKDGTFDGAYSIGVVQHTADPKKTVECVARMIKPGGMIGLFIYENRKWTLWYSKYLLRPITTRMSHTALLRTIKLFMPLGFVASEVLFRVPYLGKIFRFLLPVSNYVGVNSGSAPNLSISERYQWAIMDTFDMFAPAYDMPQTQDEIEAVLTVSGVEDIHRTKGIGLCLKGTKTQLTK